ncbi:MAG: hypothetical protein HUU60_08725 [Armatimonadetes bacterium]|nr:hypothetical protein [Armatimonadota bacterium]
MWNLQTGDYQAGWAYWPARKAVLWHGSAESAMELHSLLPPEYTHSEAEGIEVDAFGNVTVVGWAYNGMHGRNEAIVWQMAVPEPGSLTVLSFATLSALIFRRRLKAHRIPGAKRRERS